MSFLRETLAPHSLEVLFLQQSPFYNCKVSVEMVFNGPLKRHRKSLTKLSLDSSDRKISDGKTRCTGWRRWLLSHEILEFMTSGRMPKLRELGMVIDLKDWVSYVV